MRKFLVALVVCSACAQGADIPVNSLDLAPPCDGLSLDVDKSLLVESMWAAKLWNDALGEEALCVHPDGGGLPVQLIEGELTNAKGEHVLGQTAFQRPRFVPLMVQVEAGPMQFKTLIHELGHALGAGHTESGVMADGSGSLPERITAIDNESILAVEQQTWQDAFTSKSSALPTVVYVP